MGAVIPGRSTSIVRLDPPWLGPRLSHGAQRAAVFGGERPGELSFEACRTRHSNTRTPTDAVLQVWNRMIAAIEGSAIVASS